MEHQIKVATADDRDAILALLPRLAEFEIPRHRAPRELWQGDAKMVKQWANGERVELDVWVALSPHVPHLPHGEEPLIAHSEESLSSTDSKSVVDATRSGTETSSSPNTGIPAGSDVTATSAANAAKATSDANKTKDATVVKAAEAVDAKAARGKVIGVSIVSYKPELLNEQPSAHLEVLVVDKSVEGQGVASALMKHAQKMAASNGARSMSLHVFAANENARTFYDKHDFYGELLRYSKPLKVRKLHNFFGKHVASSGVARSIKKLLRAT